MRQFVNPASKKELWEYNLNAGTVKKSTPKESGCEDYYHSFETKDGVRDDATIEQTFNQIENRLPKLFEIVRNKNPVSTDAWATLFSFAALQRARSPKALYSFQKGLSEMYKRTYQIWKCSPDFAETVRKHGMNPDEVRAANFEVTADRGHTLLMLLSSFDKGNLARLLARMKWAFLIAPPDKYFFTSDDPVCCWARPDKRGLFGAVGPANDFVEITIPLSRRVCAFGSWEKAPPKLYHLMPSEMIDDINFRTVVNGWRFIYGPREDNQILKMVGEVLENGSQQPR